MENKNEDLGFLGINYQYKLISALFVDTHFFSNLVDIIDQNMFTEPNLRFVVGVMKEYHNKYESIPTYDIVSLELNSKSRTEQEKEIFDATIEKLKNTKLDGIELIKDKASKFFKQQNLIKTINRIENIIKIGDIERYYEIEDMVKAALQGGNKDIIGIKVTDNLGDVLSDEYRLPVSTGIEGLDVCLEGGIGVGELGVIIGPSSFGKTSLSTGMANHAASIGKKVVQIYFEDKDRNIQRKHIGRITGVEARNLSKDGFKDIVKEKLESEKELVTRINNNLILKKFNTGEVTVPQIRQYLKSLINTGFSPDMVIVDYFECIRPTNDVKDIWKQEANTMRQLEALASDFNIALWVPTQGTKDSISAEIVTMDKAGGSFAKIQIAHIIISIARTMDDIQNNIAKIAILKNRAGGSGNILDNVYFNNGTCVVTTENSQILNNLQDFDKRHQQEKEAEQRELVKGLMDELNGSVSF